MAKKLILRNRSLAENNPLNLLKFPKLKEYYLNLGEKAFIEYVYKVLDDNE